MSIERRNSMSILKYKSRDKLRRTKVKKYSKTFYLTKSLNKKLKNSFQKQDLTFSLHNFYFTPDCSVKPSRALNLCRVYCKNMNYSKVRCCTEFILLRVISLTLHLLEAWCVSITPYDIIAEEGTIHLQFTNTHTLTFSES